jgi:hypothetical protein
MNFTFLHRPEARKYSYKPQFYVPEEEKPTNTDRFDPEEFGAKLHRNWESRRRGSSSKTRNMRNVIWMIFIITILCLFAWKVFLIF